MVDTTYRGAGGDRMAGSSSPSGTGQQIVPKVQVTDGNGVAAPAGTQSSPTVVQQTSQAPTAGNNLSNSVTTTSGGFNIPANPNRRPGDIQGQNVGTAAIGFNEFNGAAAIGSAGTYTVAAGATFSITTNQQVNFIAASGTVPVTITGLS